MSSYSGIVGQIYKQNYDTTNTFTDAAATLQADNRTVIIDSNTYKSFKNDKILFTIKKDGGAITTPYDLYLDRIVFNKEQTAGTWTISGTYCNLEAIGGCFEWGIMQKHLINKKNVFGDTWKSSIKGLREWSCNAKRYWIDDDIFLNGSSELSTDLFIVRLFVNIDDTKSFYGLAKITDWKKGDKVEGITEAEITFEGQGLLIWYEGALPSI